ncbi:MAG: hypothetical protein M5U34_27470 [Chloroflexi bacterium]|nr:hypothetical protein [Chloroflexota bacterium]
MLPKMLKLKALNGPWLEQKTGLIIIALLSLAFWDFYDLAVNPLRGMGKCYFMGLSLCGGNLGCILLAFGFNKLVRR